MPAGFVPSESAGTQLLEALGKVAPSSLPWRCWLWVNDIVPNYATVLADLVEASFDGYSRVDLTRSEWTDPTISSWCAKSTWGTTAIQWYVLGGPVETIYGFAFVDASANKIRYIQRLDPEDIRPIVIGGKVTLLPTVTLTKGECP